MSTYHHSPLIKYYFTNSIKTTMKRCNIYKISGILIVLFWLVMIGLLVKRTNIEQGDVPVTHTQNKGFAENPSETWKEIFLKGHKVGYTVTRVEKNKHAFTVNENMFLTINLLGSMQKIFSSIEAEIDKTFLLNSFDFFLSSGLITVKVSGIVRGNDLCLSTGKGAQQVTTVIELPSKPMISAGMTEFFKSCTFKIGDSYHFPVFDPATMSTNPATVHVATKEVIEISGKPYTSYRLETNFLGQPLVFWVDEEGRTLKEKGFMGFTLIKSGPAKAPIGLDGSKNIDFYELSAITVAEKLQNPRKLSYVKLSLDQIPSFLPVKGERQGITGNVLTISKESPPFKAAYTVPYTGNKTSVLDFLKPGIFIQSTDQEIVSLAGQIIKETIDPFVAAQMIMEWVFEHVERVPTVSIPDAREILSHRKGDCNEYATILTALLRAVGNPARIVVGLVYKDGKFYYHAWNEAYIDRWISVDATLRQMPVDATHIKLLEGGIEKQVRIAGIIGNLRLSILDYR